MSATLRVRLPADPGAPDAARAALRGLPAIDDDVRAVAALLLSELVTNAVLHTGLRAGHEIEVLIESGEVLRVEVATAGPGSVGARPARW